jgi:N-acyl homoserine lactone hydrolase
MKLYLLQYGFFPDGVPVVGYLIQTDDGVNVLVDTGCPRGWAGEDLFVVDRLATIGVAPQDIHYLICTHLDVDHAGGHDEFPGAEFVVQRAHYAVAKADPRFDTLLGMPIRVHWDRPELRYRLVDGDTELLPGLELIETSGHVPGHQSLLVRLPRTGPVLLAVDAIKFANQMDPETRPVDKFDMDEVVTRASTRKLGALAEREGVRLIVHGHDTQQWQSLKLAPAYYD